MSDTSAAMREFRFLEEKRKLGTLSPHEEQRWYDLRDYLGMGEQAEAQPYYPVLGYYADDGNWYPYPPDYTGPGYPPPEGAYVDPQAMPYAPYPAQEAYGDYAEPQAAYPGYEGQALAQEPAPGDGYEAFAPEAPLPLTDTVTEGASPMPLTEESVDVDLTLSGPRPIPLGTVDAPTMATPPLETSGNEVLEVDGTDVSLIDLHDLTLDGSPEDAVPLAEHNEFVSYQPVTVRAPLEMPTEPSDAPVDPEPPAEWTEAPPEPEPAPIALEVPADVAPSPDWNEGPPELPPEPISVPLDMPLDLAAATPEWSEPAPEPEPEPVPIVLEVPAEVPASPDWDVSLEDSGPADMDALPEIETTLEEEVPQEVQPTDVVDEVPAFEPLDRGAFDDANVPLSSSFVDGEHRVIIHTVEGQVKRGSVRDLDLMGDVVPLEQQTGFAPERIQCSHVKAIFFMLPPGGSLPPPNGDKIRVTFTDGRQVAGFSEDHQSNEVGFFLVPADHRTNTARIYIFRSSVQSVSVG